MIDAFIIKEIKRRDRARREVERPSVELPVPPSEPPPRRKGQDEEKPGRVVILDL